MKPQKKASSMRQRKSASSAHAARKAPRADASRATSKSVARRPSVVPALGKRSSPEERRAQIIAVAEELFRTQPYAELSVADVAKAAGITQGLVYHYFASKEALFVAAFELRAKELLAFCLPDLSLPLPEQAVLGVRGYVDFVEAHDMAYLNLFRGPAANDAEFQRICEQTRAAIVEHFIKALQLSGRSLPVTRLSMRGYLGYAESVILEWLEHRQVSRAVLERLLHATILGSLEAGLTNDPVLGISARELKVLLDAYRAHVKLP